MRIEPLPLAYLSHPGFKPRVASPDASGGAADVWLPLVASRFLGSVGTVPRDSSDGVAAAAKARAAHGALSRSASGWGIEYDEPARANLRELERGTARLVVTGQQPGMLGGPLYNIFKAATAIATARSLERRDGARRVPVFWVAGDDHDLDEARAAYVPRAGAGDFEESDAIVFQATADRRPLADYILDASQARALRSELQERLNGRPHARDTCRLLSGHYSAGRALDQAFAGLYAELFARWGLLVLDPHTVRPLAVDVLRRALEAPDRVLAAIHAGVERVESLGLKAQVASRFPLFLTGKETPRQRHHLRPVRGGLEVEGIDERLSTGEAVKRLEKDSTLFSPGALLRPLVQEASLPIDLAVGGPAEMAYFAQLPPLYEEFGLAPTPIALRFHGALLDGEAVGAVERLGLSASSADRLARVADPTELVSSDAAERLARRFREVGEKARQELEAAVEEAFRESKAPPEQVDRLRRSIGKLESEARRLGDRGRRLLSNDRQPELAAGRALWNTLYPGGRFQERRWSVPLAIAGFGRAWIGELIEELERDPLRLEHHWILL